MNSGYFSSLGVFLIDTLVSLYVFALMLRFLLQWVEADFYNPISQFLVKLTHPPLRYLRRFIPSVRRIDTASLALMLTVQMLADYLVFTLQQISVSPGQLGRGGFGPIAGVAVQHCLLLHPHFCRIKLGCTAWL